MGTARTRILIAVTVQMALTNSVIGYVLIFGYLGFPALRIDGAVLFPGAILSIFGSDVTGVSGGEAGLRVVAFAMLLVAPAEMWLAALEGAAATDAVLGLSVLGTGIVLGWAYLATFAVHGLPYLWLGLPMSAAATLILAYLLIRAGRWHTRMI